MGTEADSADKDSVSSIEKAAPQNVAIGSKGWTTDLKNGLTTKQVAESLALYGKNNIPKYSTPTYMLFIRQFLGFMPLLIELAAIVSLSMRDYPDFGILLGMLLVNGLLGFREEYHAKLALDELSKSLENEATVIRDGQSAVIPAADIVPGDICLLVGGMIVPADIQWIRGDTMSIDTAAMTGEPIPRKYPSTEYGDIIMSGTTAKAGECYGQVVATGTNTEVGKAQSNVMKDKSVHVVSVFQKKMDFLVKLLVLISLAFSIAVLLVGGLVYNGFEIDVGKTVLDALSILIASIPIALPLVVQVNMALGARSLANNHHAVVTSLPALQDIASMSILCSDKTGTLTTANMSIITDKIHAEDGFSKQEVLLYAYLCANIDKKDDPIDRAVVKAFEENKEAQSLLSANSFEVSELVGFNPEVKRTMAFVKRPEGFVTIAKGLPAKVLNTKAGGQDSGEVQWAVEGAEVEGFMKRVEQIDKCLSSSGYKTVGVSICEQDARTEENPKFRFIGLLPMLDPPRNDTARTIHSLQSAFVSVKMITGDHVNVGRETARLIGLGTNILPGEEIRMSTTEETKKNLIWDADGFAAVLPSDKREVVLTLIHGFGVVTGMTGDGVNDAPALSAAQVGIAVNGATDAAKNAADLILTEDGLSPIYGAVFESRQIFARIKAYIIYRLAASIEIVLVLSIVIFAYGCGVRSLLVIILALLNDISMIPVAYDNASCTAKPQLPRTFPLVSMSSFFGIVNTGLALLLICYVAETPNFDPTFDLSVSCPSSTYGLIWLHLLLSTELMIFSARSPHFFFRYVPPSITLVISVLLTCAIGSLVAVFALEVQGKVVGFVWIYNVIQFLFVDALKVVFQDLVGLSPGEVLTSDKIVDEVPVTTEVQRFAEKRLRQKTQSEIRLTPDEMKHVVTFAEVGGTGIVQQYRRVKNASCTDGFEKFNYMTNI